jgi:hypothetical protein
MSTDTGLLNGENEELYHELYDNDERKRILLEHIQKNINNVKESRRRLDTKLAFALIIANVLLALVGSWALLRPPVTPGSRATITAFLSLYAVLVAISLRASVTQYTGHIIDGDWETMMRYVANERFLDTILNQHLTAMQADATWYVQRTQKAIWAFRGTGVLCIVTAVHIAVLAAGV